MRLKGIIAVPLKYLIRQERLERLRCKSLADELTRLICRSLVLTEGFIVAHIR